MRIKSLLINNLRNLGNVEVEPHAALNLLIGDNGAGKTSVLEGLVVLAKGRSFRSASVAPLIGPESDQFTVAATVETEAGHRHRLGLERSRTRWRARRDGQDIDRFSELGRSLPIVLMQPESHALVSGAPERRRRYLDWGVFHVEHAYLDTWRHYDRTLRQRNAALRRGQKDVLDALDDQLVHHGVRLHQMRARQAERVAERIVDVLPRLESNHLDVTLHYEAGWSGDDFAEALAAGRGRDIERGITRDGPHRGDLSISARGGAARERLSRGESKILAAALLMTQAELLDALGERPALLLDDVASELDGRHRDRLLEWTARFGAQTWVTGTDREAFSDAYSGGLRVFHVEHGEVRKMV